MDVDAIPRALFERASLSAYPYFILKAGENNDIELPYKAQTYKIFAIDYLDRIVIGGHAKFGSHYPILNGVVVVKNVEKTGAPHIGNHADMEAGAKELGHIRIGDHVVIGANAVVLQDVPDWHMMVGVPALVKPQRERPATGGLQIHAH